MVKLADLDPVNIANISHDKWTATLAHYIVQHKDLCLHSIPHSLITKSLLLEAIKTFPLTLMNIYPNSRTQEMCNEAIT